MLKKSTLLFIGTFFLLFIGLSDYGYGHHRPGHSGGGGGGVDDGEVAQYTVDIKGPVTGGSTNDNWITGSANQIRLDFGAIAVLDDLDSLVPGPWTPPRGENCFGSEEPFTVFHGFLKKGKGGRAEGWFWLTAHTDDEDPPFGSGTSADYLFKMFGEFQGPWPPSGTTTMVMTDWEMLLVNGQSELKNITCLGEGVFPEEDMQFIDVTLQ